MKNRKWQTFLLTLLVVAALLALFYLPRFNVMGADTRRVSIVTKKEIYVPKWWPTRLMAMWRKVLIRQPFRSSSSHLWIPSLRE